MARSLPVPAATTGKPPRAVGMLARFSQIMQGVSVGVPVGGIVGMGEIANVD
jgi:hypothetical protein